MNDDSGEWLKPEPRPHVGEGKQTFEYFLAHAAPGTEFIYATCGTLGDKHVSMEELSAAEQAK